ncbi:phosphatase PAP2 family protein [Permianibacter sp. IMCC34836]|uniref:phosphatase PAP2 family protein n=1 Tax=Permianibacter fluminis TaxID=2738515 RepID=UPI001555538E|nr:phosphatase PAP2 family protein [Permianibacter fluminis]NQD36690.1 phosphatase PAP2 family protein [Permianibacter fluminis]
MFDKSLVPQWLNLALWPMCLLLALLLLFSLLRIDAKLAASLYAIGHAFPYQGSASYELWLHEWPKKIAVGAFFVLLLVSLTPWRGRSLRRWYIPLWLSLAAMLISGSVIGTLKRETDVYCPVQIANYGGSHAATVEGPFPTFAGSGGHCWPAGHATSGMSFIALYFGLLMMAKPRLAQVALWGSLVSGHFLGLAQVLRGQHFLSHQLWTTAICWFVSLALFWLWHEFVAERVLQPRSISQTAS